jgi:hypothetical protein
MARGVAPGASVPCGVTSKFSVGVANISEAGKDGAMNVAMKNSANTAPRINKASAVARTNLCKANSRSKLKTEFRHSIHERHIPRNANKAPIASAM